MVNATAFENLKLGVERIDRDHFQIFEALNKLNSSITLEEATTATEESHSLFVKHCLHEEQFMSSIDYPHLAEHRDEHAKLRKEFLNMRKRLGLGNDYVRRYFVGILDRKMIDHIESYDQSLSEWVKQNGLQKR